MLLHPNLLSDTETSMTETHPSGEARCHCNDLQLLLELFSNFSGPVLEDLFSIIQAAAGSLVPESMLQAKGSRSGVRSESGSDSRADQSPNGEQFQGLASET